MPREENRLIPGNSGQMALYVLPNAAGNQRVLEALMNKTVACQLGEEGYVRQYVGQIVYPGAAERYYNDLVIVSDQDVRRLRAIESEHGHAKSDLGKFLRDETCGRCINEIGHFDHPPAIELEKATVGSIVQSVDVLKENIAIAAGIGKQRIQLF